MDDTPIFLLHSSVHCLRLICSGYQISFKIEQIDLFNLEVAVARMDDLSTRLGGFAVSLDPPSYLTEALPFPSVNCPPNIEAFLEVIYLTHDSEPMFHFKENFADFYFELECGYAIDVSFQSDAALIISAMAPYNAETEMTELAAQLILDLRSESRFNVLMEVSDETVP